MIQRVPGDAGGLKMASMKRPFYGDPTEVDRVFKKARFSPGLFNGGDLAEKFILSAPLSSPSISSQKLVTIKFTRIGISPTSMF